MIPQPELGKKIADLRKAKGMTQEELVEKCKLSVRTLQRIESGEVEPRSYTIRLIFNALNYDLHEINQSIFNKIGLNRDLFYKSINDLFNFKKKSMKKITVLSVVFLALIISIYFFHFKGLSQRKSEEVARTLEDLSISFNRWLNYGMIDSLLTIYRDDACVIPFSCGKDELYNGLIPLIEGDYKVIDYKTLSVSVADSIAVEKYFSIYQFLGKEYRQKGIKEWHLSDKKWLIVNQMMMDY